MALRRLETDSKRSSAVASIAKGFLRECEALFEGMIRYLPGRTGLFIRRVYYRMRMKHVGRGVSILPGVKIFGHRNISLEDGCIIDFDCVIFAGAPHRSKAEMRHVPNDSFTLSPGEVKIGKGVHISVGCYILGGGGVQIGDYAGCAGGTRILSMTAHYASYADPSRRDVYFTVNSGEEHECFLIGPVFLGDNVGVASNCILLPGTEIGRDSFLGLGSVARSGAIPPNSIATGIPAVRVKDRFEAGSGEKIANRE